MRIGIPRETAPGETLVAATPETVARYVRSGLEVCVAAGAGEAAGAPDEAYRQAGADVLPDTAAVFAAAGLIAAVRPPGAGPSGAIDEANLPPESAVLVAMLDPVRNAALMRRLSERNVTALSLDALPRLARTQAMDALSSLATLSGYRAAILAAAELDKVIPLLMTAAGTLQPASALVIGAGVAGLGAVATFKRLGAVLRAIDTRPAVREQVESLGARFVAMEVPHEPAETAGGYATDLGDDFYRREQDFLAPHVSKADMVVTTALLPHRRSPRLITPAMVEAMRPGAVIVDLAAARGGNCALTEPDQRVRAGGVTVLGPTNLPAQMPAQASAMYARNIAAFLDEVIRDGRVTIDPTNEVLGPTVVAHQRRILHEPTRAAVAAEGGSP